MRLERAQLIELWRYYQAGVVNTVFGLSIYMVLVWFGLNIFVAQFISHILGMAFNYVVYSRHVFRDKSPAKVKFIVSYGVNYALGVITLAGVSQVVASPYLAGLATAAIVSIINYFVLKHFVFVAAKT